MARPPSWFHIQPDNLLAITLTSLAAAAAVVALVATAVLLLEPAAAGSVRGRANAARVAFGGKPSPISRMQARAPRSRACKF